MLRLLRALSPSAADSVGGCLFYAVGLPILFMFLLFLPLLVMLPPGTVGTWPTWGQLAIPVAACVISIVIYALRDRVKDRLK